MDLPDISRLSVNGTKTLSHIPTDTDSELVEDQCMQKFNAYRQSLPYEIEPHSKMMEMLNLIVLRITQCLEARDYDVGLLQWDSMLT
jgi:proteasome activator subunit 4